MSVEKEPTKHWCRKIRSIFRPWDVQAGSKGYITLEDLKKRTLTRLGKFPELGDEKNAIERVIRHWRDHCNCGVEMPEGYRLTENQYVQNVWWKIHQPTFEAELRESAMAFMKAVDKDGKGRFTKEQAGQISSKLGTASAHPAKSKSVFETLDKDNTGSVTFEQSLEAQKFFFFDQESEDHPFNYVYGPLVD